MANDERWLLRHCERLSLTNYLPKRQRTCLQWPSSTDSGSEESARGSKPLSWMEGFALCLERCSFPSHTAQVLRNSTESARSPRFHSDPSHNGPRKAFCQRGPTSPQNQVCRTNPTGPSGARVQRPVNPLPSQASLRRPATGFQHTENHA